MKTIYGIVAEMRFCSLVLAAAMFAVVAGPANAADDSIKEKAALCTPCHGEAGHPKPRTLRRWRASPIPSCSGNWFSSAAAPGKTR
jgi:cytochrome c553